MNRKYFYIIPFFIFNFSIYLFIYKISVKYFSKSIKNEYYSNCRSVSEIISNNIFNAFHNFDDLFIIDFLKSIKKNNSLDCVYIIDSKMRYLFHTDGELIGQKEYETDIYSQENNLKIMKKLDLERDLIILWKKNFLNDIDIFKKKLLWIVISLLIVSQLSFMLIIQMFYQYE